MSVRAKRQPKTTAAKTWVSNGSDTGGTGPYSEGKQSVQFLHDNFASSGDTIVIPAGTFDWPTGVNIEKSLTVTGSKYTPNTHTGGGPEGGAPELASHITFRSTVRATRAFGLKAGTGGQLMRLTGLKFSGLPASLYNAYIDASGTPTSDFLRIDNCFCDGGSGIVTMINCYGNQRGVIDHCTLSGGPSSEMIHHMGLGPDDLSSWEDDLDPGSDQLMYEEDCIFQVHQWQNESGIYQYSTSGHQSYYGARICTRYCLLRYCECDTHGNVSVNGRWTEFYNNQFYTPKNQQGGPMLYSLRGGSGVFFGNRVQEGCKPTYPVAIRLYTDESSANNLSPHVGGPQPAYGPGAGILKNGNSQGSDSSPVYLWDNDPLMSISGGNVGVGGWSPSPIIEGKHFFVSEGKPSSMKICQKKSHTVGTTYQYEPYVYPHPLTGGTVPPPDTEQPPEPEEPPPVEDLVVTVTIEAPAGVKVNVVQTPTK